jgi:hypothetical protein
MSDKSFWQRRSSAEKPVTKFYSILETKFQSIAFLFSNIAVAKPEVTLF